jgi:hypothetical protein
LEQNFSPDAEVATTALIGEHPAGSAGGGVVYDSPCELFSPISHTPVRLVDIDADAFAAVTITPRE